MTERPKQSPPPCLTGAPRIKSKKVGEYELKHTLGEGEFFIISKPLVIFFQLFFVVKTRTLYVAAFRRMGESQAGNT